MINNFSSVILFSVFPSQLWVGPRTWRSTWAWWRWPCAWLCCSSWWSWSTGARRRAWMPTWRTPPSSPLASSPWASSPASQVCGHRGHAGLPPTAVGHCSLFYPSSVRPSVCPSAHHDRAALIYMYHWSFVCLRFWRWCECVYSGL